MSYSVEHYVRKKLATAARRSFSATVILFDATSRGASMFARVDNRANIRDIAELRAELPVIGTYRATAGMRVMDVFAWMLEDCQEHGVFTVLRRVRREPVDGWVRPTEPTLLEPSFPLFACLINEHFVEPLVPFAGSGSAA